MNDLKRKLICGSLCHDLGKVLYRDYSLMNHSDMGCDFLIDEIGVQDKDILDQVKYHHSSNIKSASLPENSLAYITYIADNISSMSDRRDEILENQKDEKLYDKHLRLKSIFNKLNNNDQDYVYEFGTLDEKEGMKIPISESDVKHTIDDSFYKNLILNIKNGLKQVLDENNNIDEDYLNSFLEVLESNLSFVPSSTDTKQISDISLYDHLKLTSAYASCIYDYLNDKGLYNYKECLYNGAKEFYDKKAFLILNLDLSGIQDFIYLHSNESSDMLKSLRTRSFYLEVLLENIVDELLLKLDLSRSNLIYIGGGHAYLLLANIESIKKIINEVVLSVNNWFIESFGIKLFLAYGFSECSANDLNGDKEDSYSDIFRNSQINVSNAKMRKFSSASISKLNFEQSYNDGRECSICKTTSHLTDGNICTVCKSIVNASNSILNKDFFVVMKNDGKTDLNSLPLPFNTKLVFKNETETIEMLNNSEEDVVRLYSKNKSFTGKKLSKKINFADYYSKDLYTFEELAKSSFGGYKKLAVFRADVDNLGKTFIDGFKHEKYKTKLMTLSRNATFSRMMSLFFKNYMNNILKLPEEYFIVDKEERMNYVNNDRKFSGRDIAIIYSGGDDIFAVGAWDEIINFAIDLNDKFSSFTQKTLTFSCGIGLFDDKYPISLMARVTGELEDISKSYETKFNNGNMHLKDAITLFDSPNNDRFANTYHFSEFVDKVLCDKYEAVKCYFKDNKDKGRSFLYKMMELVDNMDNKINVARFAYVLARAKPDNNENDSDEQDKSHKDYKEFSDKILEWITNKNDLKQLKTALYLYGYYSREEG